MLFSPTSTNYYINVILSYKQRHYDCDFTYTDLTTVTKPKKKTDIVLYDATLAIQDYSHFWLTLGKASASLYTRGLSLS